MPITTQLEGDLDAVDRLNADIKANSEQQQLPVARELLVQQALDSIINGTSDSWLGSVKIKPELASSILLDAQKQFENDRAKTGIVSLQTGFNKDSTNAANKDGIISVLKSTGGNMIGKYIDYQQFQDLNNAKNPRYFQGEGSPVIENPSMWQPERIEVGSDSEGNPIYQNTGRYTAYVNAYDIGNKGTLVGQTVVVDGTGKIVDVGVNFDQRGQGVLKEFFTSGVFPILMTPFLGPLAGYIGSAASSAGIALSSQMATAAAQAFVNSIPQIANGADPSKVIGSIAISLGTPALAEKLALDPTITKIAGNVLNAAMDPENFVQRLATFTIQDLATSQISQYLQDNNLISSANIANKTAGLVVQTALTQGKNLEAIMTNPSAMMNFVRSNQDLISTALNTATQEQAAQGMTPLERMAFADANAATQGLTSPAEFVQKTGMNQAQWRDFYLTNQEAARNASPQEFFDQTGMTQAQYRDFLENNFGPAEVIGELGADQDARTAALVFKASQNPRLVITADQTDGMHPLFETYSGPNGTTFVRDLRTEKMYQVLPQEGVDVSGGKVSLQPKMLGAVESLPATALYQGIIYSKDAGDALVSTKAQDINPDNLFLSKQVDQNIKPVSNLVLIRNDDGSITQRDKITGDTATFDTDGRVLSQTKSLITRLNETVSTLSGTGVAGVGELGESWSQALRQAGLSNDDVTAFFTRMKESGERMRPEFVNKQAQDFVNEIYQVASDARSSGQDIGKAIFNAAIKNPIGAASVVGQELFQELPNLLLPGGKVAQFMSSIALNVAESAGASALQKINELKESDRQASYYYGSADPSVSYARTNDQYVKDAMSDARTSGLVTMAMTLVPGFNNVVGRNLTNTFSEALEEGLATYLNTGDINAARGNAVLGGVIGGKTGVSLETGEALAGAMQRRLSTEGLTPRVYTDSNVTGTPENIGTLTFTAKREDASGPIASDLSAQQQDAINDLMGQLNGTVRSINPDENTALVQLDNGSVEVIDATNLALNPGDKVTLADSSLAAKDVSQLTGSNLYVASTFGDKALVVDQSGNKAVVSIKDTDIRPGQVINSVNGLGTTDLDAANKAQADLAARTYNGKVYDTADAALAAKNADELAAKNALDAKQAADLAARTYQGTVYDTAELAQQAKADNQAKTKQDVSQLLTSMGIDPTAQLVDSLSEGDPTQQEVLARMRNRGEELQSLRKATPSTSVSTQPVVTTTGDTKVTSEQTEAVDTRPAGQSFIESRFAGQNKTASPQQIQALLNKASEMGVDLSDPNVGTTAAYQNWATIVNDVSQGKPIPVKQTPAAVDTLGETKPDVKPEVTAKSPGQALIEARFAEQNKTASQDQINGLLKAASDAGLDLSDPNVGTTPEYQAWAQSVADAALGIKKGVVVTSDKSGSVVLNNDNTIDVLSDTKVKPGDPVIVTNDDKPVVLVQNQAATADDVARVLGMMNIPASPAFVAELMKNNASNLEVLQKIQSDPAIKMLIDQQRTPVSNNVATVIATNTGDQTAVVTLNNGNTQVINNTGNQLQVGNQVDVGQTTGQTISKSPQEAFINSRFAEQNATPTSDQTTALLNKAAEMGVDFSNENVGFTPEYQSWASIVSDVSKGGTIPKAFVAPTQAQVTQQDQVVETKPKSSFEQMQPGEYLVRLRFEQAGKTATDQQVKELLDQAKNSGVDLSDPNVGVTPEYQRWANLVYDTSIGKPKFVPLDVRPNIVPPDTISTEDTISLQDTVPAQDTIRSTIIGGQETVPGGVKSDVINTDDFIINNIRNDIEETVRPTQQPVQQPTQQPTSQPPAQQGTPFDYRPLLGLFPFLMGKPSQQQTEYIDYAQPQVPAPELYGIYQLPTPEYTRATGPTAPVGIMSGETK